MRTILLFVAFSLCVIPVFAQLSFGVTGGYSLTKRWAEKSQRSEYIKPSYFSTWHAGAVLETRIARQFYFQPQLLLSRKGTGSVISTIPGSETEFYVKTSPRVTYLELPLDVVYKFKSGFYAGAGPYIARALSGKIKVTNRGAATEIYPAPDFTKDIHFGSKLPDNYSGEEVYMRSLDFGFNFITGYRLPNNLFFNLNYSLGLSNVYLTEGRISNMYLGLSTGYFFK